MCAELVVVVVAISSGKAKEEEKKKENEESNKANSLVYFPPLREMRKMRSLANRRSLLGSRLC